MKKSLAVLLILVLVFSLAACSTDSEPVGQITGENEQTATDNDANTETSEDESLPQDEQADLPFSLGTTSGTTYENKTLGIGIRLDNSWTFTKRERLAQLIGQTTEYLSEDVAKMPESDNYVYDMLAVAAGGSTNILIFYENMGTLYGALVDEGTYVNRAIKVLETSLSKSAMTLISADKTTYTIEGKSFVGIKVHSQAKGVDIYHAMLCIEVGNYMSSTIITTHFADNTSEILKNFYLVK